MDVGPEPIPYEFKLCTLTTHDKRWVGGLQPVDSSPATRFFIAASRFVELFKFLLNPVDSLLRPADSSQQPMDDLSQQVEFVLHTSVIYYSCWLFPYIADDLPQTSGSLQRLGDY
ncbi:hypothetical protein N9L68_01475 [bacterium]|nr:hypothetical protein [bacterium]